MGRLKRHTSYRFVVGIGEATERRTFASLILACGGDVATLIHPNAVIAPDVTNQCFKKLFEAEGRRRQ